MYKIDNNHQRRGWLCADNHHQQEMVMHKISNYTTIKIENLKHVQHTITNVDKTQTCVQIQYEFSGSLFSGGRVGNKM